MKAKHQRMAFLGLGAILVAFAFYLIFSALEDTITFFYTPQQIIEKKIPLYTRIRMGGMVVKGSLQKQGLKIQFKVTDFEKTFSVHYEGMLPDLFKEGQGVVMEGELRELHTFQAKTIFAKHDETYMPPEVASHLQKTQEKKP